MDIETAIGLLGSRRKAEYEPAEEVLRRAGVDAIEPLLVVWEAENGLIRRKMRTAAYIALGGVLAFIAVFKIIPDNRPGAQIGTFALVYALVFVGIIRAAPSRKLTRVGAILGEIDDLRALGPLTKRFSSQQTLSATTDIRRRRDLVSKLLFTIGPSDAHVVTEELRTHMHYVLRHWEHFDIGPGHGTEYLCAILQVLEQVGDSRSIPCVQRVADASSPVGNPLYKSVNGVRRFYNWVMGGFIRLDKTGMYRPVDRARVIAAAEKCLTVLLARAEGENAPSRLLRPAGAPREDSLLRPAPSVSQPVELLLRPGEPPHHERS